LFFIFFYFIIGWENIYNNITPNNRQRLYNCTSRKPNVGLQKEIFFKTSIKDVKNPQTSFYYYCKFSFHPRFFDLVVI